MRLYCPLWGYFYVVPTFKGSHRGSILWFPPLRDLTLVVYVVPAFKESHCNLCVHIWTPSLLSTSVINYYFLLETTGDFALKLTACSTNPLLTNMQCTLRYGNLLGRELLLPNRITTVVGDVNPFLMVGLSWPCLGASHHGVNTIY